MENEKYYIAVNAGDRYPLLKTPQDYTEYFNEALSFGNLFDVLRYTAMTVCVSVKRKPTPPWFEVRYGGHKPFNTAAVWSF